MTTTLDPANTLADSTIDTVEAVDDAVIALTDDEDGEASETPVETPAAIAPPPESIALPVPRQVPGLIRGLAEMLASSKGTLILAIAKLGEDQLLVTIQPPAPEGDKIAALPRCKSKARRASSMSSYSTH